jgi:hypothetical protein
MLRESTPMSREGLLSLKGESESKHVKWTTQQGSEQTNAN